jgi:hypothetical protein
MSDYLLRSMVSKHGTQVEVWKRTFTGQQRPTTEPGLLPPPDLVWPAHDNLLLFLFFYSPYYSFLVFLGAL